MSTSFNVILDTRRIKKSTKTFPVKLRLVHNRVAKDFQTVLHLSEDDYGKLSESRIRAELKSAREKIDEIRTTTTAVIKEMQPFDLVDFERKFIAGNPLFKERKLPDNKVDLEAPGFDFDFTPYLKRFPIFTEDHARPGCISASFFAYIKKLISEDRIGSALCLQGSYSSLKKFKGNVLFRDISPAYLFQYEKQMVSNGRSLGYIGAIIRDLRTVFNNAIADGIVKREHYPFGKRKYIIPRSRNIKKAITIEQISQIYYREGSDINEEKAKAFWFFCYMANGMNPKDVANLKFKNINGEFFTFIRAKTALSTRSNPKPVMVFMNEDIKAIIEKWGNKDKSPDNYIFPVLDRGMSALEQHYAIRTFIQFINSRMKRIGLELGISKRITTIVSRHSFSTQLKRSGASTEFIQESLGHTDKATTENYLDSFENEVKKEFSNTLLAFKRGASSKL